MFLLACPGARTEGAVTVHKFLLLKCCVIKPMDLTFGMTNEFVMENLMTVSNSSHELVMVLSFKVLFLIYL